jgi:nucleotide-binding universal stress UspA family protein
VVLGVAGESLLKHGTGTLATKCLRKAATKVMLVHGQQVRPFRRVLACVDFSELSREAVVQAARVAEQDQAEVHVLHIFKAEWQRWALRGQLPALPDFERNYRAALETSLRNFAGDLPRPGALSWSARPRPTRQASPNTRARWERT